MARYQLDDPRLQDELNRLAADAATTWPPLDDVQRQQLARVLPVRHMPATAEARLRQSISTRDAA